ncbi:MAG: SMP-30/gluconolactonase/LRE family protein [Planctomycetota bacterium]|nr:SMP-30/gluconolactonase/LRE family protein [Planctomycetota bacterium]
MMLFRTLLACALAAAVAHRPCGGEERLFASPPSAAREGDRVRISFAMAAPTDVEVAILDGEGRKVVRHLAAGVLGGTRPPPPPLKPGLEQTVEWDGQDDFGKPAGTGPFKVRVRAGMSVRFGRIIGASPYTGNVTDMPYRAPVNGLVVGADGSLYVKMMSDIHSHGNSGLWPWHVRLFDKNGKYVRTLLPYPPSTDPAKASGFKLLDTGDGNFTPANQNSLYGVLYVFGDEIANRMVDGCIAFVNSHDYKINLWKADGSNALKTVPMWAKGKVGCARWLSIQVAFSPDGRYAYLSNLAAAPYDGKKPSDIDSNWPQGRIYRKDLSAPDKDAEKFYDIELPDFEKQKYWMPSAWDKKTAAAGIDVDAKGNVLVGDLVNQEVVEISPDGKKLSATKVPWPDKVLVSRKTGDMFVVSRAVSRGGLPPAKLVKISGRGEGAKIVAELPLKGSVGGSCALDETGGSPVLWLAGGGTLVRVEDRGDRLAPTGEEFLNRDRDAIGFVGYMDVDREAELVYVTGSGSAVWRYNGETGEGGLLPIKAVDLAIGPGGMIYAWGDKGGYHGPVTRYTRELKPAPLESSGKHTYGDLYGRAGRGSSVCGMDVDWRGRVYAVWGTNNCHLRVYDEKGDLVKYDRRIKVPEGKQEEIPVAVDYVSGYGGSVRVDLAGNIYLLQYGVPKDYGPPKGYEKDEAWQATVGTILKFGPSGARRKSPLDSGGRGGDPLAYEGMLEMYPGCGAISGWRCDGSCACTKPRFDVDDFGRLYIPNATTFSVSVRDNANNEVVRFGAYGNFDCQGPASREPKPEIPLGWPICAGASDRYIYVGDCLNHRVVRVDRVWRAEETRDVR